MTIRRSMLILLLTVMLCTCAHAEQGSSSGFGSAPAGDASMDSIRPSVHDYQGGVVSRSFPRDSDGTSAGLLNLSYVLSASPYIKLGTPSAWEVVISGGAAPYDCMAIVVCQEDLSLDPFLDDWNMTDYFLLDEYIFEYTFTMSGRYYWEFQVQDANGQSLIFQTRIFETYTDASETNASTVAGKVNSIVAQCITDEMSDYNRARSLHDWLIHHADYDTTYTRYDAAGVLLEGSGVCDSYARAYQMLLAAAGVESMIVTGFARSGGNLEPHGWNLVKLGGEWYHVDCTWDDPVPGGDENHAYFCLTDDEMALDHIWNEPDSIVDHGMLIPDADGGQYAEMVGYAIDYDFTFDSAEDFGLKLDIFVSQKNYKPIVARYTGSDIGAIADALYSVAEEKVQNYVNRQLAFANTCYANMIGEYFTLDIGWVTPVSYISIFDTALILTPDVTEKVIPASFGPNSNGFTWTSSDPSVAAVTGKTEGTDTLYALVKGVSIGNCTITVSARNGVLDSFDVTVMPACQPEFGLSLSAKGDDVSLTWNRIPGVTAYEVHRLCSTKDSILATTSKVSASISASKLPTDVFQSLYVVGIRSVDSHTVLRYRSPLIPYGTLSISDCDAILPAGLTEVEDYAFMGSGVSAVYISDGVRSIGSGAFADCGDLHLIRIPGSVDIIASDAFSGCELSAVFVEPGSYADDYFARHFPTLTRMN